VGQPLECAYIHHHHLLLLLLLVLLHVLLLLLPYVCAQLSISSIRLPSELRLSSDASPVRLSLLLQLLV
jgi:hypothetical protein